MTEEEASLYPPLLLAFVGDAALDMVIRTAIVLKGHSRVNDVHREKSKLVKAPAQSEMMNAIEPLLTEEEESIYRRGRNAKSYTQAKNATVSEYRRATGLEALLGYLFLTGQTKRMTELVRTGTEHLGKTSLLPYIDEVSVKVMSLPRVSVEPADDKE